MFRLSSKKFFENSYSKPIILIVFLFVSSCIWALVSPLGSAPDEYAHVQYSWAIKDGQFSDATISGKLLLPESINSAGGKRCMALAAEASANCQEKITNQQDLVYATNFTPGYPPFYYLIVGSSLNFGFSENIWYLMRLTGIFLGTLIFAIAILQVRNIVDKRFYYSTLLALTPMVSYLLGAVNPSGIEIIAGISLSILLASELGDRRRTLKAARFISILTVSTVLSVVRPNSWIISLGIYFCAVIFSRGFNAKELGFYKFISITIAVLISTGIGLRQMSIKKQTIISANPESSIEDSVPRAFPEVIQDFLQIIQSNFIGFDDWIYKSIGEFGYLDHRGLNLVATAWSTLIYLSIIFALQKSSNASKLGLASLVIGGIAIAPVFAYKYIFHSGFGYQARYGMALICAIPIFTALNRESNIFNLKQFRKIFLWLMAIALPSDWIISAYRYSHGLPFQIVFVDLQSFYWWLGTKLTYILVLLIILFVMILRTMFILERHEVESNFRELV
jgi:hypothetical protein